MGNCCESRNWSRTSSLSYQPRMEIYLKSSGKSSYNINDFNFNEIATIKEEQEEDEECSVYKISKVHSNASTAEMKQSRNLTFKLQNCRTFEYLTYDDNQIWEFHHLPYQNLVKIYNSELNIYFKEQIYQIECGDEVKVIEIWTHGKEINEWRVVELK